MVWNGEDSTVVDVAQETQRGMGRRDGRRTTPHGGGGDIFRKGSCRRQRSEDTVRKKNFFLFTS